MLGHGYPPIAQLPDDGGTTGLLVGIAVIVALAIGVAVWIRAMSGPGRIARPTGVTRLRPAAVH